MAQFSRPDNDDNFFGENWTDDGGGTTNIYQAVDEVSQDDLDYIESVGGGQPQRYEMGLSSVTDPVSSIDHVVRFTYGKDTGGGRTFTLDVELFQGGTLIASKQILNIDTTGFTNDSFTLTGTEADNITDYSALSIRITQTRTGAGGGRNLRCSWFEFEVPNASGGGAVGIEQGQVIA